MMFLIRPKRSLLNSRSEVDLTRTFKFAHSSRSITCIPIMVANMDTVGTLSMADTVTIESSNNVSYINIMMMIH
jgi:GMP reductase